MAKTTGQLFDTLKPERCNCCEKYIQHRKRAILLDVNEYNEDGWMPFYAKPNNSAEPEHWYWVFCSPACLKVFAENLEAKKIDLGL